VTFDSGNDALIYDESGDNLRPGANGGLDLGSVDANFSSIYVNTIRTLKNAITFYGTGTMLDFADGIAADSTNVIYKKNIYWTAYSV